MRMQKKQRMKVCDQLDKIQEKQDEVLAQLKSIGVDIDATEERRTNEQRVV